MKPWRAPDGSVEIWTGDNRETLRRLPAGSVHCCITSPPYFNQRDYGVVGQIGLEKRHDCAGWATGEPCGHCYVCQLVAVFRECRRVLRDDGTLWLNLGDKYTGGGQEREGDDKRFPGRKQVTNKGSLVSAGINVMPAKNLLGMPWRVAFALQADGWVLRSDIIWHRVNAMPGSQRDRPTCNHEYVFLLAKQPRYYYDSDAIREPHARLWDENNGGPMARANDGDNRHKAQMGEIHPGYAHRGDYPLPNPMGASKRTVWPIAVAAERESHFAVFPPKLVLPCLLAGTSEYGVCGAKKKKLKVRENLSPEDQAKVMRFMKKNGFVS